MKTVFVIATSSNQLNYRRMRVMMMWCCCMIYNE